MDWIWYLFRFDGRINRALFWQALTDCPAVDRSARTDRSGDPPPQRPKIVHLFAHLLLRLRSRRPLQGGRSPGLSSAAVRRPPDPDSKAFGTALFLWIYSATAIKRLHDRDRSGWWIVPFFVVPGLFSQFSDLLPDSNWVPCDRAGHANFVAVGVRRNVLVSHGSLGSNRFGPDPLAEVEDNAASTPPPQKRWDQQSELEIVPPSASPPGGMHVKRST